MHDLIIALILIERLKAGVRKILYIVNYELYLNERSSWCDVKLVRQQDISKYHAMKGRDKYLKQ